MNRRNFIKSTSGLLMMTAPAIVCSKGIYRGNKPERKLNWLVLEDDGPIIIHIDSPGGEVSAAMWLLYKNSIFRNASLSQLDTEWPLHTSPHTCTGTLAHNPLAH